MRGHIIYPANRLLWQRAAACLGLVALFLVAMPVFTSLSGHVAGQGIGMDWLSVPEAMAGEAAGGEDGAAELVPAPQPEAKDYPNIGVSSRSIVWIVAQMHLYFGAFVLAVPIFVLLIEWIGVKTRDERYEAMAHEFMKISATAYAITSLLGGTLAFALFLLYPGFMAYMMHVFGSQVLVYAGLFFSESLVVYIYYYSWDALRYGNAKWAHLTLGLLVNGVGLTLMVISNAWATFMMAPSGVNEVGAVTGNIWEIIKGPLWNALNLHRFIANLAFGGAVVGAYAAFRFLSCKTQEEKAHYDWMGYTANFIAILSFLPLPFAGYYLMAEVYAYSQTMGITAMGGILAWLFIVQAVLIGTILLAGNYYLWSGMSRTEGSERYQGYIKYIAFVLAVAFLVWVTPHTLILSPAEIQELGGAHHHILGVFGIMPAKNIAVNLMLIFTFLSFQLFRRSDKVATVSWEKAGNAMMAAIYTVAVINVIFAGVFYGYFTNTVYKVGSSVMQVASTLTVIVVGITIDTFMYKGAKTLPSHWGQVSNRSQYALFALPVAFTWLMALMGYVRSSVRTHWHVNNIMRDNSPENFIPAIGHAGNMMTIATVLFVLSILFVFWISTLSGKKQLPPETALEAGPGTERKGLAGMKVLAKVMGFSLALVLLFTLVSNFLPQVEGEAPKATKVDISALTPEKYAALGDAIFHGKGTCTLCHNERGRAPDIAILNLADETKKALADANYKGKATDIESYIHESMLEPSAYVVPGFGKKGTNDTVSPMPTISKPPIALSDIEINAVIAYLESKDGNDITVPLPSADAAPAPDEGGGEEVKVAATPEEALNKFGCTACHTILDSDADTGPNLKKVGPMLSEAFIRESIINPNADITKGYDEDIMPDDFAEQMTVKELEMLVKFIHAGGK